MDHVAPQSRWLFQYKGLKDPALAGAFLSPFQGLLRLLLSPFVVIPLPSSEEREKERGFQTLPTILKDAKIPYLEAFQKRPGPDQKDLSMEERERVGERILLKRGLSLAGRRVVLFDDVMTTGASMRACARILKEAKPRSLSGLVLMYHSLAKGDSET